VRKDIAETGWKFTNETQRGSVVLTPSMKNGPVMLEITMRDWNILSATMLLALLEECSPDASNIVATYMMNIPITL